MTDETQTVVDGEQVFCLTYHSHSLIGEQERKTELGAIFTTARRNNRALGITGALMISDDAFVQTLEGEERAVRELFETIREDPRHEQVVVVLEADAPRRFARWAMARVSADGGPDIRLLSNARRQEIVDAPRDRSITPAQEEVLAFMRASLGADALET
ncbi:MAG TPA: BLUF domain-containing protein [Solirubrobacteraceae bacterium]|nr:BLUF domain-containing protein [Solirubrobacteraceae bacterium]